MKRILFILWGLLIIAGVVFLGWWFRYRGSGLTPIGGGSATGTLPLPEIGNGGGGGGAGTGTGAVKPVADLSSVTEQLALVADAPTLNYFIDKTNTVTIVEPDGTIVRVSRGQTTTLSSNKIKDLAGAWFSFDGTKILFLFGERANQQASVFDVATKSWQPFAENIESASWSPDTKQFAYLVRANDLSVLKTLDDADPKAGPQELLKLHGEDMTVNWISPQKILIAERSSALVPTSGFVYDTKQKTANFVFQDVSGAQTAWDASGAFGLLFNGGPGNRGGFLRLINASGNSLRRLTLLTLPEKCVFISAQNAASSSLKNQDPTHLGCAVPSDVGQLTGRALPDDYVKKALLTKDDFYKIELASGNIVSVFADPQRQIDGDNLKTSNGRVFFVNRYDQKLYTLSF